MDVLLSWVGSRDPLWENPRTGRSEPGPILSLLASRHFDAIYLLFNLHSKVDDFARRASAVMRASHRLFPTLSVRHRPVELVSVIDYREIFRMVNHECQSILREEGNESSEYFVYLSPGTPQMQAVWILLVQSGLFSARMIEATPPDFVAPGAPSWREVDLSLPSFPQVVSPGETARLIGIYQAKNANLAVENARLAAEIAQLRTGSKLDDASTIGEGFHLREYLVAQERALYARALTQAQGKSAAAARLLGIGAAAFRARAVTLGVRERRRPN